MTLRQCNACGLEWRGNLVTEDSDCPRCAHRRASRMLHNERVVQTRVKQSFKEIKDEVELQWQIFLKGLGEKEKGDAVS
jgi:DNA-directed RNA polymerase subunit RPC12/RpoP